MMKAILAAALASAALIATVAAAQPAAPAGSPRAEADAAEALPAPKIYTVRASDGADLAVAVYLPRGHGSFPTLFAASPYRFDNDGLAPTGIFLWRETGPIGFYLRRGYAYVRLDVRGTGRSGGRYQFFGPREGKDLYEVIEWIARQPWSTGKVGGVGESYYGHSQLIAATLHPPHLACIAPFDAGDDLYNGEAYSGGIPSDFPSLWWNSDVRAINMRPLTGPPRDVDYDAAAETARHPTFDSFWAERSIKGRLPGITIPMFSLAAWGKMDLHLGGDLEAFELSGSPSKKLLVMDASLSEINHRFEDPAFHEKVMLPFYDWCLKGEQTDWLSRPAVQFDVRAGSRTATATAWPPADVHARSLYLDSRASGAVQSLNDGSLVGAPTAGAAPGSFHYPDPGWVLGVVGFGPNGPEPLRRVMTYTSEPLADDLEIAGAPHLVLYASSSNTDTNFIVKLTDQPPADAGQPAPREVTVTKGWLRAALRQKDEARSRIDRPVLTYAKLEALAPGHVYAFDVALVGTAYRFAKGHRIRIEIAPGDSSVTDMIFTHTYLPDQHGVDTYFGDADHPSRIVLPVADAPRAP